MNRIIRSHYKGKEPTALAYLTVLLLLVSCSDGGKKPASFSAEESGSIYRTEQNRLPMVPFSIDWIQFQSGEPDLSGLLDKPAGKDGFLKIADGHFYSPDNKRITFWGVNFTGGACFPEKEDAPRVAVFLSRLGVNAVRFHFMDSDWGPEKSIFNKELNTTRVLDAGQLDRLDYFVSELKKNGIYSNFNLNVGRNFREGDGVPEYKYLGLAKAVTLFDDRIISLEKEYAQQLLTHKNPYTGNPYINEPCLAIVEIVNENSLVEAWFDGRLVGEKANENSGTWSDIPRFYADELTRKYNAWLEQNKNQAEIKVIRSSCGVSAGELIPRLRPEEFSKASRLRFHAEAEFIMQTEKDFFTGMYGFLKNDLKLHAQVAGNSDHNHYRPGYALLSSLSLLDFVDGHVYWQHPDYFTDTLTGKETFRIPNTPMVNDPLQSTVVQLSRSAVTGKPYTVSETNHPFPNEFACEGIGILASYALLQDWDGVFFYTFEHDDPGKWNEKSPSYFDLYSNPVKLANLAVSSLMFHRRDVRAAEKTISRGYSREQLIEGIRGDISGRPLFTLGFPGESPLVCKTRISSFNGQLVLPESTPLADPIVSTTHELTWFHQGNGLVKVETDKTQALIGFVRDREEVTCNMEAKVSNPFCSLILSSMDGHPITSANKLLLTATARSGATGMLWNDARTSLESFGSRPPTMEVLQGKIILSALEPFSRAEIQYLSGTGTVIGKTELTRGNRIEIPLGGIPTPWYVIQITR